MCRYYIQIDFSSNKPSRGVSRLPTVFLANKLSKYRLKKRKYKVLGPLKSQTRYQKMAKIHFEKSNNFFRQNQGNTNFDTRNFFSHFFYNFFTHRGPPRGWGCGGSHKFSTGPKLSEYVQVVCQNTYGTCFKSVSKTPTFRFFRDFQSFFYPPRPPPRVGVGVWGVTQIFYWSPAFRICTGCLPK